MEIAKTRSAEASNNIEDIYSSNGLRKALVKDTTSPKNQNKCGDIGYGDLLKTIHESHNYISIKANSILQFHRNCYWFAECNIGWIYKIADNETEEEEIDGNKYIRFLSAWKTSKEIENLCTASEEATDSNRIDSLKLFLCSYLIFCVYILVVIEMEEWVDCLHCTCYTKQAI